MIAIDETVQNHEANGTDPKSNKIEITPEMIREYEQKRAQECTLKIQEILKEYGYTLNAVAEIRLAKS